MITDALRPNRARTIVLACCAAVVLAAGCEDRTKDATTDTNRSNNGAGSGASTPPSGGAAGTNTGAPGSTNPSGSSTSPAPNSGPGTGGQGNTPGSPGSPTNGQSSAVNPDARILSILNAKNQEEIEVGNLARQNGGSDAVKSYGEVLVRDHTANNTEVMRVAREGNFLLLPAEEVRRILAAARTGGTTPGGTTPQQPGGTPPSNPGPSTPPAGAANQPGTPAADPLAELRGLTGAQFDAAFVRMMHQGHAELIRIVEQAQNEVRDQRVKNLLSNTLPVLRDHENRARAIAPGHDAPGNQPGSTTPPGGRSPTTPPAPAGGQNPGR